MKKIFTILFVSVSLITLGQAPVNDDAPGAIELIVGAPCNTTYSSENATKSANERNTDCFKSSFSDALVWFKFVATASAVKITTDLPVTGISQREVGLMALYSATNVNDYSTFNILACDFESGSIYKQGSATLYATELTIGQTYYIVCNTYTLPSLNFCITVENLNSNLLSTTNTCDSGYQRSLILGSPLPYIGQSSLVDNAGKLIAILQKTTSGTLSGNTFTSQNIYTGPSLRQDGAGNYYIDRNFRFYNVSNPTNIKVKLFFLDSEIAELTAIDPSITLNTLGITRQTGDTCTNDFGAGNGSNSPLTVTATGSQNGVSWVEFITPGFSNFMIHKAGIVLPIEIEYFKGSSGKSFNSLSWKINCSNTSAKMILERSNEENNFIPIKEWNETASRCLQPFTFTDRYPLHGNNFYRLKTIDIDGNSKYSGIVHLQANTKDFKILSISPTPVTSNATLELLANLKMQAAILISSVEGKILVRQNIILVSGVNRLSLETKKLVPGYYIVTINSEKKQKESIRMLKMK